MAGGSWREGLVMRIGEFDGKVHLIDGTHRAIAYLACLESGISRDAPPRPHRRLLNVGAQLSGAEETSALAHLHERRAACRGA